MRFFTIGVYNRSEKDFFDELIENSIDTFCDIRQRRGLRGSKYKFVNSQRLQAKLDELDVDYAHIKELAPTKEIRDLQKEADLKENQSKRSRSSLGTVFKEAYKERILKHYDFEGLLEELEKKGASNVVFFCVEENPEACHRSLVTDKLEELGYPVQHL